MPNDLKNKIKPVKDDFSLNDLTDDSSSDDASQDIADEEIDILPEDIKDALGLDDNEEVKPKTVSLKGKPVKETTPITDWLSDDDAKALEQIDSIY